jgi:hypothetical protein
MKTEVYKGVLFDAITGEPIRKVANTRQAEQTWRQYHGDLAKAAREAASRPLISQEKLAKGTAIYQLEKAAADWSAKAHDRTNGLDPEVRTLYRNKAAKATAEAARLTRELRGEPEPVAKAVDLNRAAVLEDEAKHHDQLAMGSSDPGVKRYHRMLARDKRDAAAAARGEVLEYGSEGQRRVAVVEHR